MDSENREHVILGKPYIEAVEMEKTQSWMGVAFHPSMGEYLASTRHNPQLVEYQIPIKEEFEPLGIPNITIGWVDSNLSPERGIFDEWVTENDRHNVIKTNTINFFDHTIERAPRIMGIGVDLRPV